MNKILRRPKIRVGIFAVTMALLATSLVLSLFVPLTRARSEAAAPMKTRSEPILTSAAFQSGCSPAPTMTLLAPLGGEILDTGTHFNFSWTVNDPAGALSNISIRQSTDGGTTFSTIATVPVSQTQYSWTVPSIANNQNVQIEVVGNSNSCNNAPLLESGNLTIWNPGRTLTHVAEAPIFFSGGGFTSTIYLANTSANAVTVELDPLAPNGSATQNFPTQMTLNAGASATVDAASLYTIGTDPQNSLFPAAINGGIRLRHNGSKDTDIRAYVVAQHGSAEKFTTQFVYPASAQSSTATMQCAPMYYVDSQTSAFVSFQNATNAPQTVALVCNYGTGASGTPNGQFKNQVIGLGPQQTYIVDLKSVASQFDGAVWGSADVFTENPQSVVCHSVMMSPENGIAWDCPFVDPAASVNTTKVADSVMLDYNSAENAYIMICNMATASRSVTASFNTTTGASIPAVQVTVPADGQKMITLNAQQLLVSGTSTTADVRLSYNGNPSDIVAAGCSLGSVSGPAAPVKFREPSSSDGQRLTSPYFRFDEFVSGKVTISNLGSSAITAGAKMVFANASVTPLKSAAVVIPAGGVATIDLSASADGVPDGVAPVGRIDLVHSGTAGTVTAAISTLGYTDNSGQVVPFDPGPPMDPVTAFPESPTITAGGCVDLDAILDGTVSITGVTVTSPCFQGPVAISPGSTPNVSVIHVCSSQPCPPNIFPIVVATGGGGSDESDLVPENVNFCGISTALGKRLNPDGSTQFTICAKQAFPTVPLQVDFIQKGVKFSVGVPAPDPNTFSISASNYSENHMFLGSVGKIQVFQLNLDGTENKDAGAVVVAKKTGVYFALDPPTQISSITNVTTPGMGGTVPASGARVNVTGIGFRTWQLTNGQNQITVNPTVEIGKSADKPDQINFKFDFISNDNSTITGDVGALPDGVSACCGGLPTPCKTVTVINPGSPIDGNGTAPDQLTSGLILSISAPLPPILSSASPGNSNSLGLQSVTSPSSGSGGYPVPVPLVATINGRNLFHVQTVTFGAQGTPIAIGPSSISANGKRISGITPPPFCLTSGSTSVPITVDDGCNTPVSLANAWTYTATPPIIADFSVIDKIVAIVGPCEHMNATVLAWNVLGQDGHLDSQGCQFNNSNNAECARVKWNFSETQGLSALYPQANFGVFTWNGDCSSCSPGQGGGHVSGFFQVTITNTTGSRSGPNLCESASCSTQ